jgi:NitT/TauT family transport system permease protein
MSEWRIVREVTIRGQLHKIIDAVQVNGAMGYMMLTMVEKVSRSEGGVGIMLQDMEKFLSMNQIWAIQLSLVLMGFVTIDVVGNLIKRRLSPQAFMKLERR